MLTHLYIRNFVLVTETEIDFKQGMTVLSGETGAGKSIIFDALGLAIGKRAESRFIRQGAEQAEIVATFEQLTPELHSWMKQQALECSDDSLMLRRVIRQDGRSRAFINGSPSTTQLLRELSTLLIDIQGQHAHQRLLKREEQLHLLDQYGEHAKQLKKMAQQFQQWEALSRQQQQLLQSEAERKDRISLLDFQLQEFAALELAEGELPQLEEEQSRLNNGEQLLELSQQAHQRLDGENEEFSAIQQLHRAVAQLETLETLDHTIQPLREQLLEATLQANEVASELQQQTSQYTLDPTRLQWLNQRLATLSDLARKHQCDAEALFEKQQSLQQQHDQLHAAADELEGLQQAINQAEASCLKTAKQLHQLRSKAAKQLQTTVTEEIQQLGMEQGTFQVQLTPFTDNLFRAHGMDEIAFMVETNPGNGFHPLAKTASGGELSRISLAIQLASANRGQTPTLIFDEVDSGVGGGTAERIGQKLHQLGEETQILCVTHLPQVAAQGHQHLKIEKQQNRDAADTSSQITLLSTKDRIEEVARMLGGVEITEQTRAHAKEMLSVTE